MILVGKDDDPAVERTESRGPPIKAILLSAVLCLIRVSQLHLPTSKAISTSLANLHLLQVVQ
jgi:hypothetical protein